MTQEIYGIEFASSPATYLRDTAWNLAMVAIGATAGIVVFMRKLLADQCSVGIFGTLPPQCQTILNIGQQWAFTVAVAGAGLFITWGLMAATGGDG